MAIKGEIKNKILHASRGEERVLHDAMLAEVGQNRVSGSPLNGYYSLDVGNHMAQGVLEIQVNFKFELNSRRDDLNNREKADIRKSFSNMVSNYDYSNHWDGTYTFIFEGFRKGNRIDDFQHIVQVTVEEGKVTLARPILVRN